MLVNRRAARSGRRAETLVEEMSVEVGVEEAGSGDEKMAGRVGAVVV